MTSTGRGALASAAIEIARRRPNFHRVERLREVVTRGAGGAKELPTIAGRFALEWGRERLELAEERRLLQVARAGREVCWTDEGTPEEDTLVTILIPTYNRGPMLAARAIASALRQTHRNIEVLVVGDACDRATAEAATGTGDPRVRFVNLPARGVYPADPVSRWMVAGSAPVNAGHTLATGSWIAPCDDDDELTDDHVEVLLRAAREQRVEVVYSVARMETRPGTWEERGSLPLRHGMISHGTVLYTAGLRWMRFSNTSWKLLEPSDWNMWRRMAAIGVRIGFLDAVTYIHYVETAHR